MRVYHCCIGSSKGSDIGLLWLLLLIFLVLFAQQEFSGLVNCPHYVVLTPVLSVFAHLFLMLFIVFWLLFLPSLILFLSLLVRCTLLVLLFLILVFALFLSIICNCAELGVQLEMVLERIEGGGHRHNLFVVWRFCPPESLGIKPVKLALCRGHEGLMGDGGKFDIEVILMLMAVVCLEVMVENHKVSLKKDADGVVNGRVPGNQLW
jgi:hypothetical protein